MKTLLSVATLLSLTVVASAQTPPAAPAPKKAPEAAKPAPAAPAAAVKPAAGAPAAAVPVPQGPPPPAAPAKELDALAPLAKNWSCAGTNPLGEKVTAKISIKKDLGKYWYSVKFDAAKTKTMPAFTGNAWLGYDQLAKQFVFAGVDNMGGMIHLHAPLTATAESLALDGDVFDAKKSPAKLTFAHDAKTKHVKFTGEFSGVKAFEYDCK